MFPTKGFTLIEMIFVLAIIISLTFITLPYCHQQTIGQDIDMIEYHISSIINEAKANALVSHQKTALIFTDHTISFQKNEKTVSYTLPDECYFSNIIPVSFNENGNINKANHVILNCKGKSVKLVFHLGSGDYYFEN